MNKGRTVLEAKRYGIYSCYVHSTLVDATRKMVTEDISSLVVLDPDGYLAGIISRTDILRASIGNDAWESLPVSEVMSKDVVTVDPQATLMDVAKLLLDKHIHRVVVVREEDGHTRAVAVVSDSDLVYHLIK